MLLSCRHRSEALDALSVGGALELPARLLEGVMDEAGRVPAAPAFPGMKLRLEGLTRRAAAALGSADWGCGHSGERRSRRDDAGCSRAPIERWAFGSDRSERLPRESERVSLGVHADRPRLSRVDDAL